MFTLKCQLYVFAFSERIQNYRNSDWKISEQFSKYSWYERKIRTKFTVPASGNFFMTSKELHCTN
jgi:hypothetical protein